MKRILLGLLVIGLAFGFALGCKLPEGCDTAAADQTQESSTKLTLSDAGAFGEAVTVTAYTVEEDNYLYEEGYPDGNTRYTLTFATDGTWEWMEETFEAKDGVDRDGDGDAEEGWVQTDGWKGSYSYEEDSYTLTLETAGITWDGANQEYFDGWDEDEPAIASFDHVSYSFPAIFNDPADILVDTADAGDDLDNVTTFDLSTIVRLFKGNAYLAGGEHTMVIKSWNAAGDWDTDKEYWIQTQTDHFVFDDTAKTLTYWYTDVTEDTSTTTNEFTDFGGTDKYFFTFTNATGYTLNSGSKVWFSAVDGLYTLPLEAAPDDFDEDTGAYDWEDDEIDNRTGAPTDFEDTDPNYADPPAERDTDTAVEIDVSGTGNVDQFEYMVDITGEGDFVVWEE